MKHPRQILESYGVGYSVTTDGIPGGEVLIITDEPLSDEQKDEIESSITWYAGPTKVIFKTLDDEK